MLNLNIETILKLMFFQDTATPTMSGIIDLHQHVFFFIIFIFIVVAFQIFNVFLFSKKDLVVENTIENVNMGNGGKGDDNENWLKKLYKKIKAKMVKFYNDHSTAIHITLGVLFITGLSIGLCYYFQINPIEYLLRSKSWSYKDCHVEKCNGIQSSEYLLSLRKTNINGTQIFKGPDGKFYNFYASYPEGSVFVESLGGDEKEKMISILDLTENTIKKLIQQNTQNYLDEQIRAGYSPYLPYAKLAAQDTNYYFDYRTSEFFKSLPKEFQDYLIRNYTLKQFPFKINYADVRDLADSTIRFYNFLESDLSEWKKLVLEYNGCIYNGLNVLERDIGRGVFLTESYRNNFLADGQLVSSKEIGMVIHVKTSFFESALIWKYFK